MDPAAILTALAELAPAAGRERLLDVAGGKQLLWLTDPDRPPRTRSAERLAAIDALHQEERILRRGWVFVLGAVEVDGARRRVCVPVLSEPVRVRRALRGYQVVPAGDLEITPLISDSDRAAQLEFDGGNTDDWLMAIARNDWIRAAVSAAGLSIDRIVRRPPPRSRMADDEQDGYRLVAVKSAGLYVSRDAFSGSMRDTLRGWAARPGLAATALGAVYGVAGADDRADEPDGTTGGGAGAADGVADGGVLSPFPLDEAQAEVIRRARSEPVTVVSGPPGSGKSHAVAAAALDVVDRGGSVLVATQSPHAADVLGQLMTRYSGLSPVFFGDAEHRERIAAELAQGIGAGISADALRRDQRAVDEVAARTRALAALIESALEAERLATELPRWEALLPALAADAPGAFDESADLAKAEHLAERVAEQGPGQRRWRWPHRSAERRLRRLLRASAAVPLDRLRTAIGAARATQAAASLAASGGTDLSATWQALHAADVELATAVAVAMRRRANGAARWDRAARRSAAALAVALRAGRNRRRQLLATMTGDALVRGMPLWVGTASDTDDLLPPVPGLFDLVILDEASHFDQLRAAPVLARARRAVIVGDPRQLRFVSFVADVDVMATLHRHALDDRVDVRRVSAFDLATGAAPVTWLDQHYRSAPHLIEFSARRFYAGRLSVATRHPANDSVDVIDVVPVEPGEPGPDGVNRAEVAAAVRAVRELAAAGTTGIGVISPFRAQADALESALIEAFPLEELERLALRVGTVHAFQGGEAHTVVVSLTLADDDPPSRARFLADPHLFNVMVTRARERMVVLTSLTRPDGVIADYLAFAGTGPDAASVGGTVTAPRVADPWVDALAGGLRRANVPVRPDYPVGRWTVDLCAGEGDAAVGLMCRVHPDGPAAHLARQRALARSGWRLMDAFGSRWSGDVTRAVVDLTTGALAPPLPSTDAGQSRVSRPPAAASG